MKHLDKLLHAGLSLLLTIGFIWFFSSFYLGVLTATFIGMIWELAQNVERDCSWNRGNTFDLIADGIGVVIGIVISNFIF